MADLRPSNRAVITRALGSDALPRCTLAAPIQVGTYKYGVLVLETIQGPAVFSESDLPFVQTISDLIALAIDRDRLAAQADEVREERRAERMRSEGSGHAFARVTYAFDSHPGIFLGIIAG